jgi:hypothetical protein
MPDTSAKAKGLRDLTERQQREFETSLIEFLIKTNNKFGVKFGYCIGKDGTFTFAVPNRIKVES